MAKFFSVRKRSDESKLKKLFAHKIEFLFVRKLEAEELSVVSMPRAFSSPPPLDVILSICT
jgi:hypothetical protein